MSLFHYPIACQTPGCPRPAIRKVAALWSDGITSELKTYALCCDECLAAHTESAAVRREACRFEPGEMMSPVQVYPLATELRE